jgi:predicted Holliday junction resolvase-like endonuclease
MNGTRAVIIMIIVFVVALFLGFLMGSKRVSDVNKELNALKTEFETKVATLEKDLAKAKVQKELSVCKWELVQARTNASRRDFGKATESFSAAKEAFGKAIAVSKTDYFALKLAPLQPSFDEIKAGLDKNDLKVVGAIEGTIAQLETIISE